MEQPAVVPRGVAHHEWKMRDGLKQGDQRSGKMAEQTGAGGFATGGVCEVDAPRTLSGPPRAHIFPLDRTCIGQDDIQSG